MKIYLAGDKKDRALDVHRYLSESCGDDIEFTSTWHHSEYKRTADLTEDERITLAYDNLQKVRQADVLILVAGPEKVPGGKFVETGYALALGKQVVVIGLFENMMLYTADRVDNIYELISYIKLLVEEGND